MTFLHTSVLLLKEQDHQRYHLKLKTVHWPIYGNYLHIAILHAHVLRIDFEELKKITPQCIYQMDGIKQGNITTQWPNWQILIEPVEPLKALLEECISTYEIYLSYICVWHKTIHNECTQIITARGIWPTPWFPTILLLSNVALFCKALIPTRLWLWLSFEMNDWK